MQDLGVTSITPRKDGAVTSSMQIDLGGQPETNLDPLVHAQLRAQPSSQNLVSADDQWLNDALETQSMQNIDDYETDQSVNNNDFPNCVENLVLPVDDLEFDSSLITGADNGEHDKDQVPEGHTTVHCDHGSQLSPQESHFALTVDPLYEGSSLTSTSSSVLLLKYAMKHNLPEKPLPTYLN